MFACSADVEIQALLLRDLAGRMSPNTGILTVGGLACLGIRWHSSSSIECSVGPTATFRTGNVDVQLGSVSSQGGDRLLSEQSLVPLHWEGIGRHWEASDAAGNRLDLNALVLSHPHPGGLACKSIHFDRPPSSTASLASPLDLAPERTPASGANEPY